ncbi:MAG: hypothetical protein WCG26_12380, partial [Chloroflexales bacterium]
MAGNSGYWFKTGTGSAKGMQYISKETLVKAGLTAKQLHADLQAGKHQLSAISALSHLSPQPAGQAKNKPAPAPAKPMPTSGTVTTTQANGKQKTTEGIIQGDLAVVTTPYGHAVIHKPSGKALL